MAVHFPDLKTFKRSRKPNNFLVAPDAYCDESKPDAVAPVFTKTPAELFQAVESLAADRSNWTVKQSDKSAGRIHIVATTRLMRFKDDVFITILPAGTGGSSFAVYSRSRVGHSDLGKNRSRVTEMLDALKSA